MFSESEKDTKASEVTAITFEPALKTFEMDIMEQMGIKEDRVPGKTYWYWMQNSKQYYFVRPDM